MPRPKKKITQLQNRTLNRTFKKIILLHNTHGKTHTSTTHNYIKKKKTKHKKRFYSVSFTRFFDCCFFFFTMNVLTGRYQVEPGRFGPEKKKLKASLIFFLLFLLTYPALSALSENKNSFCGHKHVYRFFFFLF